MNTHRYTQVNYTDLFFFSCSFIFIKGIKFEFTWFKIQRVHKGRQWKPFSHPCPQPPSSPSHGQQFYEFLHHFYEYIFPEILYTFTIIDKYIFGYRYISPHFSTNDNILQDPSAPCFSPYYILKIISYRTFYFIFTILCCSTVCVYHNLFSQSLINGHLFSFWY